METAKKRYIAGNRGMPHLRRGVAKENFETSIVRQALEKIVGGGGGMLHRERVQGRTSLQACRATLVTQRGNRMSIARRGSATEIKSSPDCHRQEKQLHGHSNSQELL